MRQRNALVMANHLRPGQILDDLNSFCMRLRTSAEVMPSKSNAKKSVFRRYWQSLVTTRWDILENHDPHRRLVAPRFLHPLSNIYIALKFIAFQRYHGILAPTIAPIPSFFGPSRINKPGITCYPNLVHDFAPALRSQDVVGASSRCC